MVCQPGHVFISRSPKSCNWIPKKKDEKFWKKHLFLKTVYWTRKKQLIQPYWKFSFKSQISLSLSLSMSGKSDEKHASAWKDFLTFKKSSGQVECNFYNPAELFLTKFEKKSMEVPKKTENRKFSKKNLKLFPWTRKMLIWNRS